jgi:ABC-type polysaccharide/polyol phosphate transport system ATPase subunit
MLVRLAFSAVSVCVARCLVIDEALSVGDHFFQQKCLAAMERIHAQGTTLLFVS